MGCRSPSIARKSIERLSGRFALGARSEARLDSEGLAHEWGVSTAFRRRLANSPESWTGGASRVRPAFLMQLDASAEYAVIVVCITVSVILGGLVWRWLHQARLRLKLRRRFRHALEAEAEARLFRCVRAASGASAR